jgi:hypothetical protein
MDDTFVIWLHGPGKLSEFFYHLNSFHENIHFTMEIERDSHLPFFDIDICHKADGLLGHKVYCKPTHTASTSTPTFTTMLPTNRLWFPHWCTQPDLFVRTGCIVNLSF